MEKKQSMALSKKTTGLLKVLMFMKLSIVFMLLTSLQLSANVFSQNNITLKLQSADLKKALLQIEKKSSFRFLYNDEVLSSTEKVNIDVNDVPVTQVLDNMFANTNLTYKVLSNNLVVVTNRDIAVNDLRVSGRVTDASGNGIPNASVNVKGSKAGTLTKADGSYEISVPDGATLVFSSIGYETQEMAVNGKSEINITLKSSTKMIDQVIVVGYGSQRKIDVTGSVANVKGDEISKQPVTNAMSGLQGKVPGVVITNNGQPGASPDVLIRGLGTLSGNTHPLYVVDGVWVNDIGFLNPSDIESFNILKDASSESIYGINSSNGVILITTKKGKAGKPVITYNASVGYQKVTNQIKMANASEYTTLVNEKAGTQVLDPTKFNTEGTDWYHQILRNAFVTNHQIAVSGGTDKSTYNISFGYIDQDGLVKTNNFQRYAARIQNDYQLFKSLKIGYNIGGTFSKSRDIDGGIFRQMYTAYPVLPVYYADGSYGDAGDYPLGDGAKYNPQVTIDYFNQRTKNYFLVGNVYADLNIAKHFSWRTSFGGQKQDITTRNYKPVYDLGPSMKNTHSTLGITNANSRNWIVENTLTYENKIKDHSVKVLIGQAAQQTINTKTFVQGQDVAEDANLQYIQLGDPTAIVYKDVDGLLFDRLRSYFARLNYSFKNKYLLTASIRNDGSSRYSKPNKVGNFPAIGLGWIISKESFMQNQHIFDNLKLRGSWGKVGNASITPNFGTVVTDQGGGMNGIFGNPSTPTTGVNESQIPAPTTYWEKSKGIDIGLEATLLKNRFNMEFIYYVRTTENAVFGIPILGSVGSSSNSIVSNQTTIENKGWEFLGTWSDKLSKDLTYSISANFSVNKNVVKKVLSGSNPIDGGGNGLANGSLATRTVLGQPIGQFYGYQVEGVFQTDAEAAPWNAKAGDFKFKDFSGPKGTPDGIIDGFDKIFLGNPSPKFIYGINTNWNYKQFDLALDFQGVGGVKIYNANLGWRYGNENYTKDFYDHRWHGAGTSNTYPSADIGNNHNAAPSSFYVEDGSYFRIRNIQLGYTLKTSLLSKCHISKLRVYANAQNAFTFFKYKGFTPEVAGTDVLGRGIDANVYPIYATYNFGVNVTF